MNYSGLWEKRDGRTICRAFAAWVKLSDSEDAGVVAGYAGGGVFVQENFYCEFNVDTPSKLIIDFTDHVSGAESAFDELDDNAIEAAESALDILLDLHDQEAWQRGLQHPAAGKGFSAAAPSGDRDPVDHAGGDRTPAAPVGMSLLLYQHLRHLAGGRGSDPLWAPTQCLGGSAGQCLPLEFQQYPGAA